MKEKDKNLKNLLEKAAHNIFLAEQNLDHQPNRQYLFSIRVKINEAINLLCR